MSEVSNDSIQDLEIGKSHCHHKKDKKKRKEKTSINPTIEADMQIMKKIPMRVQKHLLTKPPIKVDNGSKQFLKTNNSSFWKKPTMTKTGCSDKVDWGDNTISSPKESKLSQDSCANKIGMTLVKSEIQKKPK
jgi:hypothetical protein